MERIGLAIYAACVDFLLRAAELLHITYRDANAAMFFLLWPAVTVLLLGLVLGQHLLLRRARRQETSARG
jgi:hypothetical protein